MPSRPLPLLWPTPSMLPLLATPLVTLLRSPPTPTTTELPMTTPRLLSARPSPTTAPVLLRDLTLSTFPTAVSRLSPTTPTTLTVTSPRCPTPERPSTLRLLPTPLLPTPSTPPPLLWLMLSTPPLWLWPTLVKYL